MDIPVSGHPHLSRRRGAIVNKDRDNFNQFISARDAKLTQDARLENLESKMDNIMTLLGQLLEKKNAS